jgi:hypothetical protein
VISTDTSQEAWIRLFRVAAPLGAATAPAISSKAPGSINELKRGAEAEGGGGGHGTAKKLNSLLQQSSAAAQAPDAAAGSSRGMQQQQQARQDMNPAARNASPFFSPPPAAAAALAQAVKSQDGARTVYEQPALAKMAVKGLKVSGVGC